MRGWVWVGLVVLCSVSFGQVEEGFLYVLENECTSNLEHLIIIPPEQQVFFFFFFFFFFFDSSLVSLFYSQPNTFESISLLISDSRMIPPSCRRSLLWMICLRAFPSVNQSCGVTLGIMSLL